MPRTRFYRSHPRAAFGVFILILVLTVDVAGSNMAKALARWRLRQHDHEMEYRVRSETLHHDLKPTVSFPRTAWGNVLYPMATNSLGFKDASPREIPLVPKGRRLLLLGDSFTEGVGVAHEKTFAGRIEAALAPEGTEVLNAGVATYSPSIYFAKARLLLEDVGLKFDELAVFIDISDIINEAMNYDLDGIRVIEAKETTKQNGLWEEDFGRRLKRQRPFYRKIERMLARDTMLTFRLVKGVHDILWGRTLEDDFADALNQRGALWTTDEEFLRQYGEIGLNQGREAMDRLAELCRARKVRLLVAVYPWPDQIFRNDRDSLQVRFWGDWARTNQVEFLDLFPAFLPEPHTEARVREVLASRFIPGDVHWNEAGHQTVAEAFLTWYRQPRQGRPGS